MNGRRTSSSSHRTSTPSHDRRRSPKPPSKAAPIETVIARAAFFAVKGDLHSTLETPAEFSLFLVQMGKLPTKQAVKMFWTNVSSLSWPDCIKVANTWTSDLEPNLTDAFKVIDKNDDGKLSYKEIKRLLVAQHGLVNEKEIEEIFKDSDINNDGFVDYKEFIRMYSETAKETVEQNVANLLSHERLNTQNMDSELESSFNSTLNGSQSLIPRKTRHRRKSSVDRQATQSKINDKSKTSKTIETSSELTDSQNDARSAQFPPKERRNSDRQLASITMRNKQLNVFCPPLVGAEDQPSTSTQTLKMKGCFYMDLVHEVNRIATNTFKLTVLKKCTVQFHIQPQNNNDLPPSQSPLDILLIIMNDRTDEIHAITNNYITSSHTSFIMCELQPGNYTIVPFTTGCRITKRVPPADSAKKPRPELIEKDGDTAKLSKRFRMVLMNIFDVFDSNDDGLLSREEFNIFNIRTGDNTVTDEEWAVVNGTYSCTLCNNTLADNFDTRDSCLTMKGFVQLHQMEASDEQSDLDDVWMTFQKHARPFKITITVADGTLESINVHIDEKLHRLDTLIAQLCEYIVKYSQLSHASEDTLSNEGIVSAWHSAGIVLVATAAETQLQLVEVKNVIHEEMNNKEYKIMQLVAKNVEQPLTALIHIE